MEDRQLNETTQYNALWSRPGKTIAGIGARRILDPGVGPARYATALDLLRESGAAVAFASFTFDPEEQGSVVLIPDATVDRFAPTDPTHLEGAIEDDDSERWPKMVREALVEIERGKVDKVVLSRRIRARFEGTPDVFEVASRLVESQPGANVFAVDSLVGASPELLLKIDDTHILSKPLAGSATDQRPNDLGSAKNVSEHELAADSVESAFRDAGLGFVRHPPEVVDVGGLRHFGTRFEAPNPGGFGFPDILPRLHPTAAVAGTPTQVALRLIREMEESSRGRYSGPVGWFDTNGHGEFAVALRCGLIDGSGALLHSGAGIVAGSRPDDELEETGWKLRPMLEALEISLP